MSGGFPRRAFLALGASLAGAGWAGTLASRANAASAPAPDHLALRRSTFLPLLGRPFRIAPDGRSLTVVLQQVSDLNPSVRPGAEDQFSLIFADPGSRAAISQGTYVISHHRCGQISLFVVPVGRSDSAQHYQAIIDNRPLTHQA